MVDGRDSAWRNRAPGPHAVDKGTWTAKTVKRPRQQPAHPQYTNYWAPLTRKRHAMPHSAQPRHTSYWAPRTRKRHQQEHRPQRPTESSNPTQHAKGRTGDCPGPRKETTTRRNVTQGANESSRWVCTPWGVSGGGGCAPLPISLNSGSNCTPQPPPPSQCPPPISHPPSQCPPTLHPTRPHIPIPPQLSSSPPSPSVMLVMLASLRPPHRDAVVLHLNLERSSGGLISHYAMFTMSLEQSILLPPAILHDTGASVTHILLPWS